MIIISAPLSAIIPTKNRIRVLQKTLASIACQEVQPAEIIIIDASDNDETLKMLDSSIAGLLSKVIAERAVETGAAVQRSQALKLASQPFILFMDDDIELETHCIERLWGAMYTEPRIAGCNAMITNQQYTKPGKISELFFRLMHGKKEKSYAGKCIGPVVNLLPENNDNNSVLQPVEWLNSTCTLYKRELLPEPLFDKHFKGYSFMEDVALSLRVAMNGKLVNVKKAQIFHDSQRGTEKSNVRIMSEMDLVNRYYIMKYILNRTSVADHTKLLIQQLFGGIASKEIVKGNFWKGKYQAIKKIRSFE